MKKATTGIRPHLPQTAADLLRMKMVCDLKTAGWEPTPEQEKEISRHGRAIQAKIAARRRTTHTCARRQLPGPPKSGRIG